MTANNYVPLHVHTDASLDGAGTVASLVDEAVRLRLSGLAMTDHGTLANAVTFWSACTEAGIQPILGLEAYLMYAAKRYHITLLSLNEQGFNNLIQLDTESHTHGFSGGYPLVTLENLEAKREGIFALSGCASSALYAGTPEEGETYIANLVDIFGKGQVGLEVMFIGTHDVFSRPLQVQARFGLDHFITNDTHYPCRHQYPAHQAITRARRGFTYDSEHLWLKSADEIFAEGVKYAGEVWVRQGLGNTVQLARSVEAWNMKAKPALPEIMDAEVHLRDALLNALKCDVARVGGAAIRKERLQGEWKILKTMGFLDYIYILWDIVRWAKSNDIRVGPGRGSGGGSYVLYLLGVTAVDPIQHALLFERFLNPARSDYPDVDVDFEADRRQEVLNYAGEIWGAIPIATYSTYSHKSAVHDIARVLTIPKDLELPAAEGAVDSDSFTTFINNKPDALVTYRTMLGQIRHRGKHAAGVIIPNRPVPIERSGDQLVAAWAEGAASKDLSKVGIVKFDLLGLTALSQLRRMEELTGVKPPASYDDPEVFDLFCAGDVAGVFQWSGSEGIRQLTQRIAPRNFTDLTTCNALYRPGALDAGTAEQYPEFMRNPRKLHPRIDQHLDKTYGVICYQEQVMAVVAEVMGGNLAEADVIRRLISKAHMGDPHWESEITALKIKFRTEGEKQGFPASVVEKLWREIYTHCGYSYNLSHATAYTSISYQMAWYKAHHRPAFTIAVLQHDKANAQTYILDAVASGLHVHMPHVNHSTADYELVGDSIFIPLSDIRGLGEKGVQHLIQVRKEGGHFHSYEDFDARIHKRLCNARARKMMEGIGAFSGLDGDPAAAIPDYKEIAIGNLYEAQLTTLGYIVPSPKLYKQIQALAHLPTKKGRTRFAGFISVIKQKKSEHGPYTVYTLSPSGSFWIRGESRGRLVIGRLVGGTKTEYGYSNDVKVYRLSSGE